MSELNQDYHDKVEILGMFDNAMEAKQFYVYYQPILEEKTRKIAKVVEHLEKRNNVEGNNVPISINLSRNDLYDDKIISSIIKVAEHNQLFRNYSHFEITESSLLDITKNGEDFLKDLRTLGSQVLIDDFQNGVSSLGVISKRDVDIIKQDMSFIQSIGINGKANIMISSIISAAHKLNVKVIAEGVETEEQYKFLLDNDCDYVQGFYFYHPLCQKDWDNILDREKNK